MNNFLKIENASLKKYNTLRIDATAKKLFFPLNATGIMDIYNSSNNKQIIVIGNGSNILLSKEYYDENYIFISTKHMDNICIKNNILNVDAGVLLSELSWFALENSIKGFEFLEDIPGSVGGAVIMNAGTYENMIGDLISTVTYYDAETNSIITDTATKEDFGKRSSTWGLQKNIIISVGFGIYIDAIDKENYLLILEEILDNKKCRYMKQPRNYPNAGSVFKRPSKNGKNFYVWKLFDECGLRGCQIGGAMISNKHPGFIVNVNNANYNDVIRLINHAKLKVKDRFGIDLQLEWKII